MIGTQHNLYESGPASTSVGGMIYSEDNFNCAGICDTSSLRNLKEQPSLLNFQQGCCKCSEAEISPGDVIVEVGAGTRSVLLLINGTIVSRIPDTKISSDVVEVSCASRPGRLPECAPSNLQHSRAHFSSLIKTYSAQTLVQGRFIGEESLLQGSNMGSEARLLALSEVQCLVLSLDVLEMLWCNEPLVGIRFFRNVTMTLRRRIQPHMNCLFASADLTPSPLLENVDNLEALFDGTACTRLTPAA